MLDVTTILGCSVGILICGLFVLHFRLAMLPNCREKNEVFLELVKRLEDFSRSKPDAYFRKVSALAVLGYAYIGYIVLLLILILGLMYCMSSEFPGMYKIVLPFGWLLCIIFSSLSIKDDPIRGYYLNKREFPELLGRLRSISTTIKSPPVDYIVITEDFNAAIVQKPLFGLFGFPRNFLIIGMPLLQSLPIEQIEAVIAHELGHLAGSHNARAAWIYHVRSSYFQLMVNMQHNPLFFGFYNSYVPYFDAYSFVLGRTQEYHADECSIHIVGKETSAKALLGTKIKRSFLNERYWPEFLKLSRDLEEPPYGVMEMIPNVIKSDLTLSDAEAWLQKSLTEKTNFLDTHPCTTDRLASTLGIPVDQVPEYAQSNLKSILTLEKTAAEVLFGDRLLDVSGKVEERWRAQVRSFWLESFAQNETYRRQLLELGKQYEESEITDDDIITLAAVTAHLKDFETARPIFERALRSMPGNAELLQTYGEWLLAQRDELGIDLMERAMEIDLTRCSICCNCICEYLTWLGDEERLAEYNERLRVLAEQDAFAQIERSRVFSSDQFMEHGLLAHELEQIVWQIRNQEITGKYRVKIKKAYLVRKRVRRNPQSPIYVLVFQFSGVSPIASDAPLVGDLTETLAFPVDTLIYSTNRMHKGLEKAIKEPGALIYEA